MKKYGVLAVLILLLGRCFAQTKRARDYGIRVGVLKTGTNNAITDVAGVKVGHTTLTIGDSIRTGVTAILPHSDNIFQLKVPAAVYIGNGFGKLTGYSQIKELGNIETPIILTNTLAVPKATNALISYTLKQLGNEQVQSVNSVVGETNDGSLNDIRGRHTTESDVLQAIQNAKNGQVDEGNVGAGTGTVCFGFKGGIGTASRVLPGSLGGYAVGALVQTNFGGILEINGVPVGEELKAFSFRDKILEDTDGSCMIVIATNAPLDARNLERLAKRAIMGLAKTGGIASNGSGDFVIAFSTAERNFIKHSDTSTLYESEVVKNDNMSPLFLATIEVTEEAIINSLFAAKTTMGKGGKKVEAIPVDQVVNIMKKYNRIK